MESVVAALKDTPIPTLLVIAGIIFLLLAVAGQLAGRIAVAPERQRWAALIGGGLLASGIALHIVPLLQSQVTQPPVERVPVSGPSQPLPQETPPQPPGEPPRTQPPAPALTEEKEPNNDVTSATVITEGTTVHGSLGTDQDQDFFRFSPSSYKTRVLLRTKSGPSLVLMITVYDHVEKLLVMEAASGFQPATFAFDSMPGAMYYIMVKSVVAGLRGNYELVVRKE